MSDNNREKELKDEKLENINGGIKIIYNDDNPEETSWWEKLLKIFFKH